jgi:hypothetical protein
MAYRQPSGRQLLLERNALRANPFDKLGNVAESSEATQEPVPPGADELLDEWPVPAPPDWLERVNAADTAGELAVPRRCVHRGSPFGDETWVMRTAGQLALSASHGPPGRPRKKPRATSD